MKVGNHCFIARSNYDITYAKLHAIKVDKMRRRTFCFQYYINTEYTKDISEDLLVDHIRRANQFIPNSVGSFVITQNSTNAGHSNDMFKLVIGPLQTIKIATKSGKYKGLVRTQRFCQVVGCSNHKYGKSNDGVDLCSTHGSMYKRSGSKIDDGDITEFDVIGCTNSSGNNTYNALCDKMIEKWFDDDTTNDPDTIVKLSLVKTICKEFSHQVPSGRFLIRVGKGTDQETILEMTDDEIYSKTHKHMVNLRNALKSEYIL